MGKVGCLKSVEVSEEVLPKGKAPVLGSVSDGRVIILPSDVKGKKPHLL